MFNSLVKTDGNHHIYLVERSRAETLCRSVNPSININGVMVRSKFHKLDIFGGKVVVYYTAQLRLHGVKLSRSARYRLDNRGVQLEHVFPVRIGR